MKKSAIKQTSHSWNQLISNIFLMEKKNMRHGPVIKVEPTKSFSPISSFQNGGSISSKRNTEWKRFHGKTGPPGHIFQHSTSQEQQEICHFPVRMEVFWVPQAFRVGSSIANFYKTPKNTNTLTANTANPFCIHDLLKMDSGNGISASREGHGYFHTSEPWFCNKQRKSLHGT